jgi:DNA-binding beta-propeller fold protein YncE
MHNTVSDLIFEGGIPVSVVYRLCCILSCLFVLLLSLIVFSPSAHADGGAPQLAYVAGTAQGVSIIDIAQRKVTGTIAIPGNPHTVLLSPDGQWLYVAQPTAGRVTVVNAKTEQTLCSTSLPGQPSVLALSLDATILYAAGPGDTSVRALNPMTCAVQQTFTTKEPIYGLAVTAAGAAPPALNQLWITGATALTIFEINGHLLDTVPLDGGPQNISMPNGFTAYVTTRQGTVVAVDISTRRVFRTLLTGGQFGPMDYDANTGEVYVPDQQHRQLDVLAPVLADTSLTPKEPERVIPMSDAPQSVAITSDGQLGFVALAGGQVVMLDIPGRSIVTTIPVGGTPHFLITGLYPPANVAIPTPSPQRNIFSPLLLLIVSTVVVEILLFGTLWFLWKYRWSRPTNR